MKPKKKRVLAPKAIARRWFDQLWNRKNPAVIAELMSPSAVGRTEGGEIRGPAEFRSKVFEPLTRAFPAFRMKLDGLFAEGENVAIRWTFIATHDGPFGDLAATGRTAICSGMTWLKCRNGKIVGGSDHYNLHGLVGYLSGGPASATVRAAKRGARL